MSRWSILKDAIHGKSRSTNNLSIHRFDGFNFLAKKKAIWLGFELNIDQSMSVSEILETFHQFMSDVDSSECILVLESSGTNVSSTLQLIEECKLVSNFRIERISTSTRQSDRGELVPHVVARMYLTDDVLKPSLRSCEYWTYDLPSSNCLITREQQKNGKLNVNSLLSNKFVGVDNTGNVCVWPSEALLLYILLVEQQWKEIVRGKTVLELGGGMTSLAGIGIAASGLSSEVTVTDGHPDCVVNQRVCIAMNKQRGFISGEAKIDAHLLNWSSEGKQKGNEWESNPQYDVILASDCLFFKDFHVGLLETIRRLLLPNGTAILLQPPRHGTMRMFLDLCIDYFNVELFTDYCAQVSSARDNYGQNSAAMYDEDIHYPILVKLTHKCVEG